MSSARKRLIAALIANACFPLGLACAGGGFVTARVCGLSEDVAACILGGIALVLCGALPLAIAWHFGRNMEI